MSFEEMIFGLDCVWFLLRCCSQQTTWTWNLYSIWSSVAWQSLKVCSVCFKCLNISEKGRVQFKSVGSRGKRKGVIATLSSFEWCLPPLLPLIRVNMPPAVSSAVQTSVKVTHWHPYTRTKTWIMFMLYEVKNKTQKSCWSLF